MYRMHSDPMLCIQEKCILSTYLWVNRQQIRTLPKVHLMVTQAHMGLDILQTKKYKFKHVKNESISDCILNKKAGFDIYFKIMKLTPQIFPVLQ